jgi:WD40 repeat protein
MSAVRHLAAVVRGPRLLAAGLVLVLAHVFATNLTPSPRFVVRTEAKLDRPDLPRMFCGDDVIIEHVSDDAGQVIVGTHSGDRHGSTTRLQMWDVRTGINRTPAHWMDPDWQMLLYQGFFYRRNPGPLDLLSCRSGREFLADEAAWTALGERFTPRPVTAARSWARGRQFLTEVSFSPDGRLVAYPTRNGCPVYLIGHTAVDGTRIDDTRTGQLAATLPGVTGEVTVAPGGRTAVSHNSCDDRVGEQPWLTLWDLETSTPRAQFWLPDRAWRLTFGPDGKYVFAATFRPELLRWWDAQTGKQVGEIDRHAKPEFIDGGRVLVIRADDRVLHFWDVATGRELPEWDPPRPRGGVGRVGRLLTVGGGRYLVAEIERDPPTSGSEHPAVRWMVNHLSDDAPRRTQGRIAVLDAIDRHVIGHAPGLSAAVSTNDRWLATLDADGVVRVWELPLRRPWGRAVPYAAAVVLGVWGLVRLFARLRRRRDPALA